MITNSNYLAILLSYLCLYLHTFKNETTKLLNMILCLKKAPGRGLHSFYFSLDFYFVLGYSLLTNNVVIVSSEQLRDSAIRIHVPILPQTPLSSSLPHNTEQSSMCYTVDFCWLFILNIKLCICPSQTP